MKEMSLINLKIVFLLVLCIGVSSCSVPTSPVYIDNSGCGKNISEGVFRIIESDIGKGKFMKDKTIKDLAEAKKNFSSYLNQAKSEFDNFSITKDTSTYYFLTQKNDNACWLKLYRKVSNGNDYLNSITFMDSYELNLCRCGGTKSDISL